MKVFNVIINKSLISKVWFVLGVAVTVIGLVLYILIDNLTSRAETSESLEAFLSITLVSVSIVGIIINIMSVHKLREWQKIIPLLLVVICVGMAVYGYFIATFQL